MTEKIISSNQPLVAIDLGSNSFHMVIARVRHNEIRIQSQRSEKVQLASGLNEANHLSETAQSRGLDCLAKFAQRIQEIDPSQVRVVGTNALRKAKNAQAFVERAESLLGAPVEIIAGREEARLIYLGACHGLENDTDHRLVIDIGGGSTEFILGQGFEPKLLESLHIGCVAYRDRFFPQGHISAERFQQAVTAARSEIALIDRQFKAMGWKHVLGSSGSIRTIAQITHAKANPQDLISKQALTLMKQQLLQFSHTDDLHFSQLKPERRNIFPAGLAILYAAFEQLGIDEMRYTQGALREGLLLDHLGQHTQSDVRNKTTDALMAAYQVDTYQAEAVNTIALHMFEQLKTIWNFEQPNCLDLLTRAAKLHEIGLFISHTQFHKHGAYLLRHSDLHGFSRQEQTALALVVRTHRRKFPLHLFDELPLAWRKPIYYLSIILRISVLLCHSKDSTNRLFNMQASARKMHLEFPEGWLSTHPLTQAELQTESIYLSHANFELSFS